MTTLMSKGGRMSGQGEQRAVGKGKQWEIRSYLVRAETKEHCRTSGKEGEERVPQWEGTPYSHMYSRI